MKSQTIPDEDEEIIRLSLMEESPDFESVIEQIYHLTKNDVAAFLRKKHSFFTSDDRGSVASVAYIELDKMLRERKVDLNRPIPPLLFTIVKRRAIDLVKKRNSKKEKVLEFKETDFMDTLTAHDWVKKQKSGDAEEIREKIREYIANAPPLTKAVGEALLHLAPPSPSPEDLKNEVDRILGKPTTGPSVSSTLSRLRRDLKSFIQN